MHVPVLLKETMENLAFREGDVFVDATVNRGGHSAEACRLLQGKVKIVGIDLDDSALKEAKEKLSGCDFTAVRGNFRKIDEILRAAGLEKADKILFDLGLSAEELAESGRGFSFAKDEPLLMTYGNNPAEGEITARDVVNSWSGETLEEIIRVFGEERFSRRIAEEIVAERATRPLQTTSDLVRIIARALPKKYKRGKTHFATKTFQAIRMAVNDELSALLEALPKAFHILKNGGRLAVMTFHSLEDRVVKKFFNEKTKSGLARHIGGKPIKPSRAEILKNRPSRSAKLRIVEKIND